jgi:hypothetical protein
LAQLENSLYSKYGDVNYNFNLSLGDIVTIKKDFFYQEFSVLSATVRGDGKVSIQVSPDIDDSFTGATPDTASFLSKQEDESNVILDFAKRDGETSYGLLIPENVSPNIAKNIDEACLSCPVAKMCYESGIENNEYGVWGGVYLNAGSIDNSKNTHKTPEIWKKIKRHSYGK